MYDTRRNAALDAYLASVQDTHEDDLDPTNEEWNSRDEAPSRTPNRPTLLHRVLEISVPLIRRAAPPTSERDEIMRMAWTQTLLDPSFSLLSNSFAEECTPMPRFIWNKLLHVGCSGAVLAVITAAYLGTSSASPWQRTLACLVGAMSLLHILFPIFDILAVHYFRFLFRAQCHHLVHNLQRVHDTKRMLEATCNESLRAVKAAAVAHRGYLLDTTWMPPIGRLEANDVNPTMQCLHLRHVLHALYTQLASTESSSSSFDVPTIADAARAASTPSLLLLALSHQHKAAMEAVARSLDALQDGVDAASVDETMAQVAWWQARLQHALAILKDCHVVTEANASEAKAASPPQDDEDTIAMRQHMHLLRNVLDTASAVLFAAQQDLRGGMDAAALAQAAARTRQLLDDGDRVWTRWQGLLHAGCPTPSTVATHGVEKDNEDDASLQPEDGNMKSRVEATYTQVFAAVSTGQGDAMRERPPDDDVRQTVEVFNHVVHELEDVLARRPLPEERVKGNDAVSLKTTTVVDVPRTVAAFQLPSLVSSELRGALAGHFGGGIVMEESFGSDDEVSDEL
ncbi:Aste57867_13193 [Aphanomyces stellatus]|uniref:Aste57867_13193 protein n=1 Tax=Aphanomyces stellatus TaxID=120398 RepID=A0A485KXS9_9STRA|nr:hypothetical protein As57867_013144 [Aphanomyces stellatus]VFT90034.1 Aste57867_13193 [Aphanomyces stellatus]